jgi:hypothetical protein
MYSLAHVQFQNIYMLLRLPLRYLSPTQHGYDILGQIVGHDINVRGGWKVIDVTMYTYVESSRHVLNMLIFILAIWHAWCAKFHSEHEVILHGDAK